MNGNKGRRASDGHASSVVKSYYPNMDIMRYILAIAVLIAHINFLTGSRIPFPLSSYEAVGGFFAISGFLMYPNYTRHNNLLRYTRQRARRILPPYIFIVIAAAIVFSAISTLSPSEYFSSKGFFEYLGANLSFLNWLQPELPGVFQGPQYISPAVNGSLWTMKVEWCLYFSVPIFVWLQSRMKKLRKYWLALAVIIISIAYRIVLSYLYFASGNEIYSILRRQIFGQLSFFYAGMLIYFIKDTFVRYPVVFLMLGILLRIMMNISVTCFVILEPFSISFIVLSLSLLPFDIKALRHRNNVSYEMYLFHYPIIQLGIYFGLHTAGMWVMATYSFAATVLLAIIVHCCTERWVFRVRH